MMILTKPQAKKLFKVAKKITQTIRDTNYDNVSFQTEKVVSLEEMLEEMKFSKHWYAGQCGNELYITSSVYSFTIEV